MTAETALATLKSSVQNAVRSGDFLIGINRFSDAWIYTGSWNIEETRACIEHVLAGFWITFLQTSEEEYVLLDIEYLDTSSEKELSISTILQETVRLVNSPKLSTDKVLVDPDSFELYMPQWPTGCEIVIFVELSVCLDLLIAVCSNLRALGCKVNRILTIVEREEVSGPQLRNTLHVELIPFFLYNEQEDNLYSILELHEAPYTDYHQYFS